MLADSHCHINAADFAADREAVVERARQGGVRYILDVSDDVAKTPEIAAFCATHKDIYTTVGVHPELAEQYGDLTAARLLQETGSPYVVGIGECGLDYFYNGDTREAQIKVLQAHIAAAQESGLPLIVHNRDADADMAEILTAAYKQKPFSGELHCFSSGVELCRTALDMGFYISASGIITFKKSEALRQIFATVPLKRLLVETDSPYLAPTPQRGQRNEPALVVHTAAVLAQIKGITPAELAQITTQNFLHLFTKVRADE